ncbi:hypothetical protein [Coraliomargarita sinensis]|uniref:hypothetical protein n=1 Tax=Coraliomargarita sinensis TaxID=2174842 RepID=UPI0011B35D46|nr:hypothetical protein [Coraliomargarita sinensis]
MKVDYSDQPDPPEYNDIGFPVLGEYYQLSLVSLDTGIWSNTAPVTDLSEGIEAPSLVSRHDTAVTVAHWTGDLLHIDTLVSPANTRTTLPIPKRVGSVAVDANEGLHVLAVNPDYELWHYYYADENLTLTKLSDGPVCHVVAVAGEGDDCHVAYSTFSEDVNLNGEIDTGEDLNANGVLDETPMQLIYQSVDTTTPSSIELVDDDTLLKLCAFDIYFSSAHGVKLAYSDPVGNAVRFSERGVSAWSTVKVSTIAGMFESVALDFDPAAGVAITYINAAQNRLYVAEESGGIWSETLIAQVTTGDYFAGADVAFDSDGQVAVLTAEKDRFYLNVYTRSALPDFLSTLARPIEIRSAFIITWPTPSEGATKQILQSSMNLSDSDSWEFVAQRSVFGSSNETMETTVEMEGPSKFYRVVEQSD